MLRCHRLFARLSRAHSSLASSPDPSPPLPSTAGPAAAPYPRAFTAKYPRLTASVLRRPFAVAHFIARRLQPSDGGDYKAFSNFVRAQHALESLLLDGALLPPGGAALLCERLAAQPGTASFMRRVLQLCRVSTTPLTPLMLVDALAAFSRDGDRDGLLEVEREVLQGAGPVPRFLAAALVRAKIQPAAKVLVTWPKVGGWPS